MIEKIIKIYFYIKIKILFFCNNINYRIFNNNNKLKIKYLDWLISTNINNKEFFIPLSKTSISESDIQKNPKLITFYLPQFYENEVNDKNFGKGFMEWYNVTKCIPQYTGHYQPHLPIDVGFYNLTHDDIMYRQIELAKQYGISGFCFYYYWFSGDRLLEKPLENFLKNKELNIPFCLFWANETWSHLWDNGNHRDIIKKQELLDNDDEKFINDIIRYFKDERYIKINNKPLLIIYKTQIFPEEKFKKFIISIKNKIKKFGFEDIYLLTTDNAASKVDYEKYNFDGIVEFSNQYIYETCKSLNLKGKFVNPSFKGKIYDVKSMLNEKKHINTNYKNSFKCACAGWDNSSRKAYSGAQILHMSPVEFKHWLNDIIDWTKQNRSEDSQYLFIDSWNEWAEGAHLEPDQKYGYAYLQAVKDVLEGTK